MSLALSSALVRRTRLLGSQTFREDYFKVIKMPAVRANCQACDEVFQEKLIYHADIGQIPYLDCAIAIAGDEKSAIRTNFYLIGRSTLARFYKEPT